MNKSFSKYRNIWSPIHKIDPITKFALFIMLTVSLFFAQTWTPFLIFMGSTIVISLMARVKFKSYLNLLLVITPFFLIMFSIYALVSIGSEMGPIALTVLMMSLRVYLFLLIAIIYTTSTREIDITRSIDWYLTPLKYIKVPTYEISMIITLAIRFIPVLIEDLFKIMRAQTSRGLNVINGNLKTKVKGISTSLLPMLIISFRRADDLAIAMHVRNYKIGKKRTKYWENKFGVLELVSAILITTLLITTIVMGVM